MKPKPIKYKLVLSSCGNPDHGQFAAPAPTEIVEPSTLKQCQQAVLNYIKKWGLGGGNWTGGLVTCNGREVGRFAYNGTMWVDGIQTL